MQTTVFDLLPAFITRILKPQESVLAISGPISEILTG